MATKYVCDRCSKETESGSQILHTGYKVYNQYDRDMSDWLDKKIDLCGNCIRDLNEFMKPLPKEAKNE